MTRQRWLVSVFIVWHLVAIGLAALPTGTVVPRAEGRRSPANGLSSALTPVLDAIAAHASAANVWLRAVLRPVRAPMDWYLKIFDLAQPWGMFSSPPKVDQYARVRFYIRPASGSVWAATELVMPAHREDEVRLIRSFRDSYQDKAIAIMSEGFYSHRAPALIRPDTRPSELPDDLAPIGRYFARVFQREHLRGGTDRIVRTEVWLGTTPTPPPGEPAVPASRAAHLALLESYFDGPVEHRLAVPPYPPYHGVDQEGDIRWVLEYFEEP